MYATFYGEIYVFGTDGMGWLSDAGELHKASVDLR